MIGRAVKAWGPVGVSFISSVCLVLHVTCGYPQPITAARTRTTNAEASPGYAFDCVILSCVHHDPAWS